MKEHPIFIRGRQCFAFLARIEKKISDLGKGRVDIMHEYMLTDLLLDFLKSRMIEASFEESILSANSSDKEVKILFEEIVRETEAFTYTSEERDLLLARLLAKLAHSIVHPFRKRNISLENTYPIKDE